MTAHPYHKKLARVLDRMGGLFVLNDILTELRMGGCSLSLRAIVGCDSILNIRAPKC